MHSTHWRRKMATPYLHYLLFDFRRVNKYDVKAKKMYESIFKELKEKHISHLVVDLRNNTGGRNEFADDILPFILQGDESDKYFKWTTSWEGKRRNYKMPKRSKYAYEGSLYVLINGKTYSAGSSLARYLKEYGDAVVVGNQNLGHVTKDLQRDHHTRLYCPTARSRLVYLGIISSTRNLTNKQQATEGCFLIMC